MDVVLRFLAAFALAHLLQCSRDTNALHPVFFWSGQRWLVLSPGFSAAILPSSSDLRKILTDLATGGFRGAENPLLRRSGHWRNIAQVFR